MWDSHRRTKQERGLNQPKFVRICQIAWKEWQSQLRPASLEVSRPCFLLSRVWGECPERRRATPDPQRDNRVFLLVLVRPKVAGSRPTVFGGSATCYPASEASVCDHYTNLDRPGTCTMSSLPRIEPHTRFIQRKIFEASPLRLCVRYACRS